MADNSRRLMRSALMFRAMQEIADEEITYLQDTPINKQNVKVAFKNVRALLEKELNIDDKNYSVINKEEITALREEEKKLIPLEPETEIEVVKDLKLASNLPQKSKVKMKVKDRLKEIRSRRNELLELDNQTAQSYYCIYHLLEKIIVKLPQLNLDEIIEVDTILDLYFKKEFKFIPEEKFSEIEKEIAEIEKENQIQREILESEKVVADRIIKACCTAWGISEEQIKEKTRKREITDARCVALVMIERELEPWSYKTIVNYFGFDDHVMVVYSKKKFAEMADKDFQDKAEKAESIFKELTNGESTDV